MNMGTLTDSGFFWFFETKLRGVAKAAIIAGLKAVGLFRLLKGKSSNGAFAGVLERFGDALEVFGLKMEKNLGEHPIEAFEVVKINCLCMTVPSPILAELGPCGLCVSFFFPMGFFVARSDCP